MSCSPIIRFLFALRGIRARTLSDMEKSGFGPLEEIPGRFLALGMIGRPWLPGGQLVRFGTAQEWAAFDEPGYAKVSWTFLLESSGADTAISTETRVRCTDDASSKKFSRYWLVVSPFSGLARKEMLRCLKRGSAR